MKRVYSHLNHPEQHYLFGKRALKAVTREALENKIQFSSLRMFKQDPDTHMLTDFHKELDTYTVKHQLGKVIWPFCDTLKAANLRELAREAARRGLYLYDFWGYVPGSYSPSEPWGEYEMRPDARQILEEELGDHFMGFDNGEQDGRYIGTYAPQICAAKADRTAMYLHFLHHFEAVCDFAHHATTALCSLHYGHYFLKENDVMMIGAECAQALPSVNLWYAFLRGAGKQYGVLWFGNASVWNRWGYKNYCESGNVGYEFGPDKGTSASLLRRILYTHYSYNCDILGYEAGWIYEAPKQNASLEHERTCDAAIQYDDALTDTLTPVGVLQRDAARFVGERGYAGVMLTPVALMLDFYAGYAPSRHLYTGQVYQTWGALPYGEGDYLTHALFDLVYPGFEDAGFFRDERGFLTPTPMGDMFDVLLSDAECEVLDRYNVLALASDVTIGPEELYKFARFAENGGTVVAFAGSIDASAALHEADRAAYLAAWGLARLGTRACAQGAVRLGDARYDEPCFELYDAELLPEATVLADTADGRAAAYELRRGEGRVIVLLSPFGLNATPAYHLGAPEDGPHTANEPNAALPAPFSMLSHVRALLRATFEREQLVSLDDRLTWSVNYVSSDSLQLTVSNNTSAPIDFDIRLREGKLLRAEPVELPNVDTEAVGYLPYTYERAPGQGAGAYRIEPLDVRMYELTVSGLQIAEKPPLSVPFHGEGRYLRMQNDATLREQIATYATIASNYEGVKVDARYLMERESDMLAYEAAFVKRRALDVIVDFSSLFNHFPDFSMLDNIRGRYERNMGIFEKTLDKAALYGCRRVVICPNRNAENHVSDGEADEAFARTANRIAGLCEARGMQLYIQNGTPRRHNFHVLRLLDWIKQYGVNAKPVWNIAHSLLSGEDIEAVAREYGDRFSALLLCAPGKDLHGQFTDAHLPLYQSALGERIAGAARALGKLDFVAMDALYEDARQSFRDLCLTAHE